MKNTDNTKWERWLVRSYKVRWPLTIIVVLVMLGSFVGGISRIKSFTSDIDSLGDTPPESTELRMFDPRSDIWFDANDPALLAYRDIEARFIAEDTILVAFTEATDPHGVFSLKSLQTVDRLTKQLRQVPYVRTVRSLVASPWIRWGTVADEEGLIVGDLFEDAPETYTENDRLERMVSILGAANASQLIGEDKVRELIGSEANQSDYLGEPRLLGNVLSEDGRSTALVVQVIRPRLPNEKLDAVFGTNTAEREAGPALHTSAVQTEALRAIRRILAAETTYDFHLSGIPVFQEHYMVVAEHDMSFVGLMFLAIAIILFVLYRRVAGVLIPLATVFLAILGMLGVILMMGDLLNSVTAMTPHMLVAIGVASAVHLITAYYRLRPQYADKHELVQAAMRFNALPVLLTSVTTVVGFLSLTTSGIFPIRQFGYSTAIGTVFAFVIAMVLVPSVLSLLPLPKQADAPSSASPDPDEKPDWSRNLARLVVRRRLQIVGGGVLLTAAAVLGVSRLQLSSDLSLMFGNDDPMIEDMVWMHDHLGGTGDLELLFTGAKTSDTAVQAADRSARINELTNQPSREFSDELARLKADDAKYRHGQIADSPKFLDSLYQFQRQLESEARDPSSPLHNITGVDSALGVIRKIHQVQNENRGAYYRVPIDADVPPEARQPTVYYDEFLEEETIIPGQSASTMIAQYYLQYENGAKPEDNLSSLITPDRRMVRVSMRVSTLASHNSLATYARLQALATEEFPELAGSIERVNSGNAVSTMEMTGTTYMQVNMITEFTRTLIVSLCLALGIITLIISLVFRSLLIGLVSMVPNLLPIMLPFGFLAYLGVALDGPAMLVAAVALGICVDDTIHFLTKYTRARARGLDTVDAISCTYREVGVAITYTSIVLACGFAMMSFATFRANVMIGILGAAMIGLAWLADFVLTPAVLSFIPYKRSKSPNTEGVLP